MTVMVLLDEAILDGMLISVIGGSLHKVEITEPAGLMKGMSNEMFLTSAINNNLIDGDGRSIEESLEIAVSFARDSRTELDRRMTTDDAVIPVY